jgi:hypothetical protein
MWLAVHKVQIISVLEVLDPDRIRNSGVGSATFFRKRLANTVSGIHGIPPNTAVPVPY